MNPNTGALDVPTFEIFEIVVMSSMVNGLNYNSFHGVKLEHTVAICIVL